MRSVCVLGHPINADAHFLDRSGHSGRRIALHLRAAADLFGCSHQCERLFEDRCRGLADAADRRLQILRHLADGLLQMADLVGTVARQPACQVAGSNPVGCEGDFVQRPCDPSPSHHEAAEQGGDDDHQRHPGEVTDDDVGAATDFFDVAGGNDDPVPGRKVIKNRNLFARAGLAGICPLVADASGLLVDHLANELETPTVLGGQQVGPFLGRVEGRDTFLLAGVERADIPRAADLDRQDALLQNLQPFGKFQSDEKGTDHLARGVANRDIVGHEIPAE